MRQYPDQYCLIREERSGEETVIPLSPDEPLDIAAIVAKWARDTSGGWGVTPRRGDTRADGYRFAQFAKRRLASGRIALYEVWREPAAYERALAQTKIASRAWKARRRSEEAATREPK